jgi:hypothetical protein
VATYCITCHSGGDVDFKHNPNCGGIPLVAPIEWVNWKIEYERLLLIMNMNKIEYLDALEACTVHSLKEPCNC